jgi:hypothetical protein
MEGHVTMGQILKAMERRALRVEPNNHLHIRKTFCEQTVTQYSGHCMCVLLEVILKALYFVRSAYRCVLHGSDNHYPCAQNKLISVRRSLLRKNCLLCRQCRLPAWLSVAKVS